MSDPVLGAGDIQRIRTLEEQNLGNLRCKASSPGA